MSEMAPMPAKKSALEVKFEKAERLFREGELAGALTLFAEVAQDDDWFFRAYRYLVQICDQLKVGYVLNSPERKRITDLELFLERNKARLTPGGPMQSGEQAQYHPRGGEAGGGGSSRSDSDSRPASEEAPAIRRRRGGSRGRSRAKDTRPAATVSEENEVLVEKVEFDHGVIERVPHIDVMHDGAVRPGDVFEIAVYLDTSAQRAGETGFNLIARSGSEVEVNIIASSHFRIQGGGTATFTLSEKDARIDLPRFRLSCLEQSEWGEGLPSVIAVFFVDGRPCGKVARTIDVAGIKIGDIQDAAGHVEIGINGLPPADLTITIVADPANDGRRFWCSVSTPHLPAYRRRATGPWNLKDVTQKIVEGFMDKFTSADTKKAQLISALSGAGVLLFDASPAIFQKIFWEMIDAGVPFRTIAIVSEEPFMPWELMIPSRLIAGLRRERAHPLGVDFDIGRWTDERIIAPARQIVLSDSHVVAPAYDGEMVLDQAAAEAEMVFKQYPGTPITPVDFEGLEAALGGVGRSLVHFICHGKDEAGGLQAVYLEGGDELTSASILGMRGVAKIFAEKRPVVFLNACEVGRGSPALVGLGGFVSSFIRLGATAVIAPLWSVEDAAAHAIAEEFYRVVRERPGTPFSRIFTEIRAKAYDRTVGEDTYAAYCFYGDPYAAAN
jgi:hypothetical protein